MNPAILLEPFYDNIWQAYIFATQSEEKLLHIYSSFRKHLEDGQIPSLIEWRSLDDTLQQVYPQFRETLLSCHHLTDIEYRLSLLVKAEFLPKEMAALLCRSREAISSTRRRLSKRVLGEERPSPQQWDEHILSL